MAIPPVPGSFCIERACGSRAYGVNGIFEPTAELQNGMPCYKKKVWCCWRLIISMETLICWLDLTG